MNASERQPIRLHVNGEARQAADGITVAELLAELRLDPRAVAVELDGRVVPRGSRETAVLGDGARLEIVRFVQGG